MSDNIPSPMNISSNEKRPLPLIVADLWNFPLAFVVDGIYWFSIRDWMAGLTGVKDPKNAWNSARKSPDLRETLTRIREFPYGTGTSHFIDDRGLYEIAILLRNARTRTVLPDIKSYLAASGAFADLLRRDPNLRARIGATAGPEAVIDATIERYQKDGFDNNWIHARLEGVITRKQFTSALKAAVLSASSDLYWKGTEKVYAGLWKRTTRQLRGDLGITDKDSVRDNFGEYALIYTRLAEMVATERLKDAEIVPEALAMEIVYEAAKLIRIQAQSTSEALGIDLVTAKPLLQDHNR